MLLLLTDLPDPPTDLRETGRSIIGDSNCSHEIEWTMTDRRGLKEFRLIRLTNFIENSNVMERYEDVMKVHFGVNRIFYNKELTDNVTLAVVAMNQCDDASNMSNTVNLCKLHISR